MKSRPILFSAPMVRAILDRTKTQTRRVVKTEVCLGREALFAPHKGRKYGPTYLLPDAAELAVKDCPYGQPGDQLWVREAWADLTETHGRHWERLNNETSRYERGISPFVWYRADGDQPDVGSGSVNPERWKPSIYMPRWASRITLEITRVRIERLVDISEADAIAEGCTKNHNNYFLGGPHKAGGLKQMATARQAYKDLWESINGSGAWDSNPWAWVLEFKRVTP